MLDKVRQGEPYTEWSKSKGRGRGRRYFAAPCEELKIVQRGVLNQFLKQIPVHFARHGGTTGSSILSNADHHVGAKTLFAVDIVDAFPGVYRSRVRACLKKPLEFGLRQFKGVQFSDADKEQMLESIVELLTWKDRLPQGPPTSPRVFEIVSGKSDRELFALVEKSSTPLQTYRLSIYADNITISSDGDIPEEFRKEVVKILQSNGFHTHTRKDKMMYYSPETGTVPVVTGLIIAEDRLIMHPNKVNQFRGRLGRLLKVSQWSANEKGEIAGILGFIRQIYPPGKNVPSKLRKSVEAAERRIYGDKIAETRLPGAQPQSSKKGPKKRDQSPEKIKKTGSGKGKEPAGLKETA
jgi:hypothetical protein